MDYNKRLSISYYQTIGTINETHKIYIVQHQETHKIYIKKILDVYNKAIYEYLFQNPIAHTPKIYEIYEEADTLTVIEEYISGETLEDLLNTEVPLDTEKIKRITIQLCQILSRFHTSTPSIIHRDIKPSNIIITPSNEIYLLDFNAAKYQHEDQLEDTTLLGTKGYAAPEQYGFGASNIQTDIYAIGMLINTMVNGSFSPSVCEGHELTPIIKKCTRLNPLERYKNVNSIIKKLSSDNETYLDDISRPTWWKYLPPGFRTLQPVNIIVSTTVYITVFWLALSLEVMDSTPENLYYQRIFFLLTALTVILCTSNYLNIQDKFPPCRTNNKILKILSILLLDFLVIISLVFILVVIISM